MEKKYGIKLIKGLPSTKKKDVILGIFLYKFINCNKNMIISITIIIIRKKMIILRMNMIIIFMIKERGRGKKK